MAMHKIADLDDAGSIPARLSRELWEAGKALSDACTVFINAEKAYREALAAPAAALGSAGGKARAKALTPAQRSAIGRKGAEKRWAMYKDDGARGAR